MYCVECGKKLEEESRDMLCPECHEKNMPKKEEKAKVLNETIVDDVDIKKNYGLANGITGLCLSFGSIFLAIFAYLMITASSALYTAAQAARDTARSNGADISGVGLSGFPVIALIIFGIIIGLLAITLAIIALCLAVKGLKKAKFARANNVKATASFIVGIVSTVFSSISLLICVVYTFVVCIMQFVLAIVRYIV